MRELQELQVKGSRIKALTPQPLGHGDGSFDLQGSYEKVAGAHLPQSHMPLRAGPVEEMVEFGVYRLRARVWERRIYFRVSG